MPVTLLNKINLNWWSFPAGERGVKILGGPGIIDEVWALNVNFHESDDIMDMLLLVNAIRHSYPNKKLVLNLPYFPYARQDRIMSHGETNGAQVMASIIKMCKFSEIKTIDPHSDVVPALFDSGFSFMSQSAVLCPIISKFINTTYGEKPNAALISPDTGAVKKIYKSANKLNFPVVEASKTRDVSTGTITGVKINQSEINIYDVLIIMDDICDGGRTFIELGNEIRRSFKGDLILAVTHGIFSKGKDELNTIFNDILCYNDMSKGVK